MNTYFVAAHPGGQSGHDTETQALAHADWLVKSKAAKEVVVYEVPWRDADRDLTTATEGAA